MPFQRFEGFQGSIPQKFADNRIPICPMCGSKNPHWSTSEEMGEFLTLDPERNAHKYLYRCEQCECILKIPVTDVIGVGRSALLSWQGLAKKVRGKETKAIYVTIVDVGKMQLTKQYLDKELTLDELNNLARSINNV